MPNFIIGYTAEKKKSPWPIIIVVIIIIAVLLLWYVLSGQNQPVEKKVVPKPTVIISTTIAATTTSTITKAAAPVVKPAKKGKILQMVTAYQVEGSQPQKLSREFLPGETVYFYTTLQLENTPQTIKHVWLKPGGDHYATIDLTIVSQPANTWSYITLPPQSEGEWIVRVESEGSLVDKLSFKVK